MGHKSRDRRDCDWTRLARSPTRREFAGNSRCPLPPPSGPKGWYDISPETLIILIGGVIREIPKLGLSSREFFWPPVRAHPPGCSFPAHGPSLQCSVRLRPPFRRGRRSPSRTANAHHPNALGRLLCSRCITNVWLLIWEWSCEHQIVKHAPLVQTNVICSVVGVGVYQV